MYAAVGVVAAVVVCLPRYRAEIAWWRAIDHESRGAWSEARGALEGAIAQCPQLASLERVRLFQGKLDYRENRVSLERELWLIDQWRRNNDSVRAIATLDSVLELPDGDVVTARFAAQSYARVGVNHWEVGRWAAAGDMWRRAAAADPQRWDCRYLLGNFQARMDRDRPELVDAEFSPILRRLADRVLRADLLASLGDAYFDAGQIQIARTYYTQSLRAFELPKDINYRARKGLVGM
jgi:tetratricopeptide (TPR) repeat protein